MTGETLPAQLLARAAGDGGRVAIREKTYGIWRSYTWAEYVERVHALALGFARYGFGRGDRLAIVGDNRPELYWALLAAQTLGGTAVPLYQDATAGELQYAIAHAGARIVVAEDQEQLDKVLEVRAHLPAVEYLVYEDPKGLRHYAEPGLKSLDNVERDGRAGTAAGAAGLSRLIEAVGPEDIAVISYTSGTTGASKGVMLSHRALLATGRSFLQVMPIGPSDKMLAYLPMGWIVDTFFSVVVALLSGASVNCPESAETVRADFREIGPTVAFAPPRIWENLLAQYQVRIEDADWLKRTVTRRLVAAAMGSARRAIQGGAATVADRLRSALGDPLVFASLRDQLGLRCIRLAITGGAPIAPEVLQFYRGIGVNLRQLYGMTECSAPATVQPEGPVKPDTVGAPIPGVRLRIDDSGEVLISSPGAFSGYYRDREATASTLCDGWLRTGDAGLLDSDGHLVILDRAKDVSHLEDGTVFAPQYVENKLKFSPYIKEVVAIGNGRAYVAAMVNIDADVVGNWAERRHVAYSGYTDMALNPRVGELIAGEVRRMNELLPPALRVRRFVVLHKELDPDDAEITRTRKVRRRIVADKYAAIIAALYDPGAGDVDVRAAIRYEDGREAQVSRSLRIYSLDAETAAAALTGGAPAAAIADP